MPEHEANLAPTQFISEASTPDRSCALPRRCCFRRTWRWRVDDSPAGRRRLVGIYMGLAKDLRTQIETASPQQRASLSASFDKFLSNVSTNTKEFGILNWVAATYAAMGDPQLTFGEFKPVDLSATLKPKHVPLLGEYCWHKENSRDRTWPVGSLKPNEFGVFDATGNVWEWSGDWFSPTWHKENPCCASTNPKGPKFGEQKSMRGGSFLCHDSYCNRYRVAARTKNTPESATTNLGFRCVRDI